MTLFNIDADQCVKDHHCVAACPLKIIEYDRVSRLPRPVAGAGQLCIACGHCVAICPTAALTHRDIEPEACLPVDPQRHLNAVQAEHFLRNRRSIRNFKDQAVDRQKLLWLLDMARYAPSGHNRQPVKWLVVQRRETVKQLTAHVVAWMQAMLTEQPDLAAQLNLARVVQAWQAGMDVICRDAPHLIIAHAAKADRSAPAACTIALSYLELAATALQLGTCWAGYFGRAAAQWPGLQQALALPEGHICFGAMMVGYPSLQYHRMPTRRAPDVTWY